MSTTKKEEDPNNSVICLDSSIDDTVDNDNDTNNSVLDVISFDKTLPPGVAPDGFIIIDETEESEKINVSDNVSESDKNDNEEIDETEESEKINATDIINENIKNHEETMTKPMFKVIFRDQNVSRLYKKRVRDFFYRLASVVPKEEDLDPDDLVLEVWNKKSSRKRSHDHLDEKCVDDTEDLDVNMLFRIEKRPTFEDRLDVPTYGKKFEKIMDSTSGTEKSVKEDEKIACRPKMRCWNCMGNHSIRDCTQPRNQMEITKNRNEFTSRTVQKANRYHVDNEGQKYDRFVPGQISRDLKRALGISDNQLPHHIYRMRMLGYPPGWLKEARLQHSGMNLYDSDDYHENNVSEVSSEIIKSGDDDQYDANKIQDFPGFNVRPPSGTREEDKKYWKSNRYTVNSKESLLSMINVKKIDGYKRKKLKRNEQPNISDQEQISSEMDVVEDMDENITEHVSINGLFIPPLPMSPPRPPLPLDPEDGAVDSPLDMNSDIENVASPIHADSPSLADLERRKKQLLAELDDSSVPSPPSTPLTSKSCSSTSNVYFADQLEKTITSGNEETGQTVRTMCNLPTPLRGTIKSVDFGTPILDSTSPYSKLPSVENFAKNVCDIINFENLPDSTGKYEQMSGILQKVRKQLATNTEK